MGRGSSGKGQTFRWVCPEDASLRTPLDQVNSHEHGGASRQRAASASNLGGNCANMTAQTTSAASARVREPMGVGSGPVLCWATTIQHAQTLLLALILSSRAAVALVALICCVVVVRAKLLQR